MDMQLDLAIKSLSSIKTSRDFRRWIRYEFRQIVPNGGFLATAGRLYGVGSVPSHRLNVDFPLELVEELKNPAGALDDPLMFGWFRNQRVRHVDVADVSEFGDQQGWRSALIEHGIRSMLIHGYLDHEARRFVVFQLCNTYKGKSPEVAAVIDSLAKRMADVVWGTIDGRAVKRSRYLVAHPTLSLTPTEIHIVKLLAQGMSNKEIAKLRGVSDSTVKTQVSRTGVKLGATRRAEIVAVAMPLLSPLPAQSLLDYDDV